MILLKYYIISEFVHNYITLYFFGSLFIGFPRSVPQAQELDKQLTEKRKADILLNLDVPFEIIVDRMSKRFTHLPSGRVYNLEFNAPKVPV